MIINDDDYTISIDESATKLEGTLRLPSPSSYDEPFAHIREELEQASETYIVDTTELEFLNSSGITAMARLFMHARKVNKPIKLVGNKDIPWQTKSLVSLKKLWDKIDVELR